MGLEEKVLRTRNLIYDFVTEPENNKEVVPEVFKRLYDDARRFMVYKGYVDYLKEMMYPTMGDYYVGDMRRGRRYEKELRNDINRILTGNLVVTDSVLFYKVLNDARHILDGTLKGAGLESKLGLGGWRGRRYSLDELRGKWYELRNDRRLNPRVKEFFQLLDRYDSRMTEALEYVLFLKGLFPKPLEPGSLERWDVYREGVRRAIRYLEEVVLYAEVINRLFLPEDVNSEYQKLFLFNSHFPDHAVSPVKALNNVINHLFDGVKGKFRENLPVLEAYIVAKYNPRREGGYYVIENRVDFIDGSWLIDTVELPVYSRRKNIGRKKALEILRQAGYGVEAI